ncbi:dihydrofolate reductase [Geobacter sp. DSM 9736]|uniref:dihydrofolate reductase n=1 Tax=Geobacter sp. DSM 9736 TaxID=1277350 RepID=UPI000B510111|nr:dihydrofolate reductase [Geobacter sp. DSM 9736]SNB46719.1 dihydrofolate reductase [Geobacter sp. DSM 9736]
MNAPVISIIAAVSENGVIGCRGGIPWHLPADLARFKSLTMGHPLIVGRRTFESIGRPLPGRRMIVLSRQQSRRVQGCLLAHNVDEALQLAGDAEEVFVGGGREVYEAFLAVADRIYLTVVHRKYDGDVSFPVIPSDFVEAERVEHEGPPRHSYITYERRQAR